MFWCSDIDWEFSHCRGVRRLPASLSGRRSFVVKMPRPHGNCKFRKRCESQPPENMPWHGKAMCDRLNTKDVNGPRVVLWLRVGAAKSSDGTSTLLIGTESTKLK